MNQTTEAAQNSQKSTPMMQQYFDIKRQNEGYLLFYRMGDFYEMFFDDAIKASAALDIALTSRNREKGMDVPMCGVPVHSHEIYLSRLIKKGFKVAICEQMEDPVQARKEQAKLEEEARAERDRLWGEAHENDTDEQLLEHLRQCAERLGHSPVKAEVEGGNYIAKRFVTWPLALQLAELPLPKGMKPAGNKDVNAYRRQQMGKTENIPQNAVEIDSENNLIQEEK